MNLAPVVWIFTALVSLTSCNKEPLYQEQGYVFGTLVEMSVYGEEEHKAKQAVFLVMQEFQRLHNMLHGWKPSELSDLNTAFAQGKPKVIGAELAGILRDASELSSQSGGLFNPGIGELVKLWGFHAEEFKATLPDEKKLAAVVAAQPSMSEIVLSVASATDKNKMTASSRNRALKLDLGGYAKGYALDRAAELLKKMGVNNALVNIGGNVMALGKHGSRAWRVGIQHPRKPGPLATLDLNDGEAIGTSGDYQRYFEVDGIRYCHLIDPRNGQTVKDVQAVTIITHGAHAGVLSDVSSKPVFIAGVRDEGGKEAWLLAAEKMQLNEVLLIDKAGTAHLTAAMQKRLEFSDKNMPRRIAP